MVNIRGLNIQRMVTAMARIVVVAVIAFVVSSDGMLCASEQLTRFFEQLRNRELYGLAERYCLEELNRKELPPHLRITLAYEFSRTLAQHALIVPREQQSEMWERSLQVLEQARAAAGVHERTLLLDLQGGFVLCSQAQALRWDLELTPDDPQLRKQALELIAAGIKSLSSLDAIIRQKILKPARKELAAEDKFTSAELRGLLASLQFELGQAYFERAGLLESGNAERFAAIDEAEKLIAAALGTDRNSEFGQTCQILLAGCARLKINAPRALRLLDQIDASMPSQAIADLALAERVRVLMMQKLATDAATLLTTALRNRQPQPGELVALRVQVLIELWRVATEKKSPELAKELDEALDQQLEKLKVTNPGYWTVYCEALISLARDSRTLGVELAEMVRRAKGLYGARQIPEAIAAYAEASKSALKSGKPDLAFDMTYTRGSIEIEASQFAEAARTFAELEPIDPQNPRVPEAQFLAAFALGQVYFAEPSKRNREAYSHALETHRQAYPDHPTYGEATWMLAQLEEKRLQNSAAIRLYQEVPADHPRAGEASAGSARCYDLLLTRLRDLKQPTDQWETDAEQKLSTRLPQDNRREILDENQAAVAIHLSNIYLQAKGPSFAKADRLLEWVIRSASRRISGQEEAASPGASKEGAKEKGREKNGSLNASQQSNGADEARDVEGAESEADVERWTELRRVATRLRVVSLAGQGRVSEAEESLLDLADTSPSELLAIISGLSKLVSKAQDKPRHQLGELQLRAALKLAEERALLPLEAQRQLDQCLVEAYVAAGRYEEAVERYRAALKQDPKDLVSLASLAQLLMKLGKSVRTEEAQGLWKQVEELCNPGSDTWFEARLNIARCDLDLNKPDRASKLLKVTKALYPDPKSQEMKQRFADLHKECETALQQRK